MPDKYIIQRRTASGLENVAELPALENGKIDMSWLPVVGESGAAIIARGSNANGEWVRWEDGTQVCWHIFQFTPSEWLGSTGTWIAKASVTFPASFIVSPTIIGQSLDGAISSRGTFIGNVELCTNTGCVLNIRAISSNSNVSMFLSYLAIGRWK